MTLTKTFWLSFSGEKFLGVAVIDAKTATAAIQKSHRLGINPGGEVMVIEMPPAEAKPYPRNKLLPRKWLVANGDVSVLT